MSDLAPGQLGLDDMKMLEQKAQQLAAEAEQDKAKPKEKILFVRSVLHLIFYFIFVFSLCVLEQMWLINPPLFSFNSTLVFVSQSFWGSITRDDLLQIF